MRLGATLDYPSIHLIALKLPKLPDSVGGDSAFLKPSTDRDHTDSKVGCDLVGTEPAFAGVWQVTLYCHFAGYDYQKKPEIILKREFLWIFISLKIQPFRGSGYEVQLGGSVLVEFEPVITGGRAGTRIAAIQNFSGHVRTTSASHANQRPRNRKPLRGSYF